MLLKNQYNSNLFKDSSCESSLLAPLTAKASLSKHSIHSIPENQPLEGVDVTTSDSNSESENREEDTSSPAPQKVTEKNVDAPIDSTSLFPPKIPCTIEKNSTASESDSLNVSAKETQVYHSDEVQQVLSADTQVIQSSSVDKSLSNPSAQTVNLSDSDHSVKHSVPLAGIGQGESSVKTTLMSESDPIQDSSSIPSHISDSCEEKQTHTPSKISSHDKSSSPISAQYSARERLSQVKTMPEVINPFLYPNPWELSRNGLMIAARNLAGLVLYAFDEWKEYRKTLMTSFIQ